MSNIVEYRWSERNFTDNNNIKEVWIYRDTNKNEIRTLEDEINVNIYPNVRFSKKYLSEYSFYAGEMVITIYLEAELGQDSDEK